MQVQVQVLVFSVYGVVIVVGIVLNVLFIVVTAKSHERKRSVTRMLIANLAFSDVLLLLMSFFSAISSTDNSWKFGDVLCKATPSISSVSTFVSSFFAMAIAIHRFFSIVEPQRRKLQPSSCWTVIAAIWIVSVALSLPVFVKTKVKQFAIQEQEQNETSTDTDTGTGTGTVVLKCVESWDQRVEGHAFTIACLVIQFVLPTIIIGVCYGRVICVLRARLKFHRSRAYHRNLQRIVTVIRRQTRTTCALTFMVGLYIVSWMPLNLFNVVLIFCFDSVAGWPYTMLFYIAAHLLAISSAVYNPIIYAWLNEEFRRDARYNLHCCLRLLQFRSSRSRPIASQSQCYAMNENKTPSQHPYACDPARCQLNYSQYCCDSNDR